MQCKKEITAKDKTTKLHRLNPFLDERGILRMGGWLEQAALHPHIKHPAILLKASHISTLLIKHYHQQMQHQGRGITMNANGIWVIGCNHAVSSYIHKCVKCRKFRLRPEEQKCLIYPMNAWRQIDPLRIVGWTVLVHSMSRREGENWSVSVCCSLFTFINVLRTFIAVRGNVQQLWSDQGTNFIGAKQEFLEAVKEMNQECLNQLGCEFVMNPPSASHMGGALEKKIRTIQSVLTFILDPWDLTVQLWERTWMKLWQS